MSKIKIAFFLLSLCFVRAALADEIIQFTQQSDGVHVDVSGSLDLTPLAPYYKGVESIGADTVFAPQESALYLFSGDPVQVYFLPAYTIASGLGDVPGETFGTWVSGGFGIDTDGSFGSLLFLAPGYVSGTELDASAIFSGTFSTLGLTPGTITYTLPGDQTIEVEIETGVTPEPPSLVLVGSAVVLLAAGAILQQRRRALQF